MKKLIGGILVLILVFGMCLFSLFLVGNSADTMINYVSRAQSAGMNKDFETAEQEMTEAARYWEAHISYLGILLRHDEADQIGKDISQLIVYAQTGDRDEFTAICAGLKEQLGHIQNMEFPIVENIL